MPSYDYICESCKEVFEVKKKMNDPHPTVCPKCNGGPVERYIGRDNASPVQYKGSGWMKTDGKY